MVTHNKKQKDNFCVGWQETFDAALDIIALISEDFRILKINKTGYKSLGLTPEELIGKKCYEIVHGLDCPIEGCPCKKAMNTNSGSSGQIFDRGKYYIATASPIFDDKNNFVAFAHTVKDITELKSNEKLLKEARDNLEQIVRNKTVELIETNEKLKLEIKEHKKSEKDLIESESKLKQKEITLMKKNAALSEIIAHIEIEKSKIKEEINLNVERIILPLLERLEIENEGVKNIELIKKHLEKITSKYGKIITGVNYKLSPREIEICNMVKTGITSKDISKLLNVSVKTVDKHRRNIRKKLNLTNTRTNLTTLLREF